MKLKHYLLGVFLLLQSLVYGKSVEVAAGPFAYFGIELPQKVVAGEHYAVKLTAYDVYGNKTNYFGETGRAFSVKTTGNIAITPSRLDSGMFGSGSLALTLSDPVSEAAAFILYEDGKPLLVKDVRSGEFVTGFTLNVVHATLETFALALPKTRVAGEPFEVTVTAKDTAGHTIAEYDSFGKGVTVDVEGKSGKRSVSIPAQSFKKGVAAVSLLYDVPEAVRITATEFGSGTQGSAGPFELTAQVLSQIKIKMPTTIRAGVRFALDISLYNQFGRIMKSYDASGRDIKLSTNGTGRLIPDLVPAAAFVGGRTKFETIYTKPEAIEISAAPVGGDNARQAGADASPAGVTPMTADATVQRKASAGKPAAKSKGTKKSGAASAQKGLPLSLRFSPNLGNIVRIDSEYRPLGKHGVTFVTVSFAKGRGVQEVQPIKKEIRAHGRVIGTLSMDGMLDDRGRMVVRIDEKEPFSVEAKSSDSTLHLRFFLPAR